MTPSPPRVPVSDLLPASLSPTQDVGPHSHRSTNLKRTSRAPRQPSSPAALTDARRRPATPLNLQNTWQRALSKAKLWRHRVTWPTLGGKNRWR